MENTIKMIRPLIVSPKNRIDDSNKRANPYWTIIELEYDFAKYYNKFLNENNKFRQNIYIPNKSIQTPKWKPHITVLDGRKPLSKQQYEWLLTQNKKRISFEYDIRPYKFWKFWCLEVFSKELDEIRKHLGLPKYQFHITIGREEE